MNSLPQHQNVFLSSRQEQFFCRIAETSLHEIKALKLLATLQKIHATYISKLDDEDSNTLIINPKRYLKILFPKLLIQISMRRIQEGFLHLKHRFQKLNKGKNLLLKLSQILNQYEIRLSLCQLGGYDRIPPYTSAKKFLSSLAFNAIKGHKYNLKYLKEKGALLIIPIVQRKVNHHFMKFFQIVREIFQQQQTQRKRKSKVYRSVRAQLLMTELKEGVKRKLSLVFNQIILYSQLSPSKKVSKKPLPLEQSDHSPSHLQFERIALEAIRTVGPMVVKKNQPAQRKLKYHSIQHLCNIFIFRSLKRKKMGFIGILDRSTFHRQEYCYKEQQTRILQEQLMILREDLEKVEAKNYEQDD